jgi:hypothetical protein
MFEEDDEEKQVQSTRITESFALFFVTLVLLLLFIKILFF